MFRFLVFLVLVVLSLNAFSSPLDTKPDGTVKTVELPGTIR